MTSLSAQMRLLHEPSFTIGCCPNRKEKGSMRNKVERVYMKYSINRDADKFVLILTRAMKYTV